MPKKASKAPLLPLLQKAVKTLLQQGHFENGMAFLPTQEDALQAYNIYLNRPDLSDEEKLQGFFEIPTGIGKTAIFAGIVGIAHSLAAKAGNRLKTKIVVPTIQLMKQTHESFAQFAPSLANNIGHYGDRHKNLKSPITIITYDSWVALAERKTIGPQNTDLLISDEAHRGTSDLRTDLFEVLDNKKIVRLAFTATAHFDEQKSVNQTHKRQIYYKSLPDAVRGGELAAYIQTQLYIIRVAPPKKKKDEFTDAANGDDTNKFALRKAAWSQRAIKIFAEGKDKRTGDPLSDNQAGFFVADIDHAKYTEKLLNADPVLAHKAAARGCKRVAVAIHSKLSRKSIRQRMEDYKAGKYMVVIGDEMFKEGFDHKPMKTIIDWPRKSLVDKAQIMGRGARKWENPLKDYREEGLTFIDTIVYVGSDDPKEEKRLRNEALRRAILASDILEDAVVLGPKTIKQDKDEINKSHGWGIGKIDEQDIEEYTDLVGIHEILQERSQLRREHVIDITEEMRQELNDHILRTGIGSAVLCKGAILPEGLTPNIINNWNQEIARTVDPNHWDWVIARYQALPDAETTIYITDEMHQELENHILRTGVKGTALCKSGNPPKGFNRGIIDSWRTRTVKTAKLSHWNWAMACYQDIPKIKITDEMRQELNDHRLRTGIGSKALCKSSTPPKKLTPDMISDLYQGLVKTADRAHWDWIIATYTNLPDKSPHQKRNTDSGTALTLEA